MSTVHADVHVCVFTDTDTHIQIQTDRHTHTRARARARARAPAYCSIPASVGNDFKDQIINFHYAFCTRNVSCILHDKNPLEILLSEILFCLQGIQYVHWAKWSCWHI